MADLKKCPNCGRLYPGRYKFCPECGADLRTAGASPRPTEEEGKSDLISREAFKRKLYEADCVDKYGFVNCGVTRINILLEQSAVDAVEVGSCDGCIYGNRKRPQKCSCCRRNRDLKDCYERREENA